MRILCFTPFHPDYGIHQESLDSIMAMRYDGVLDRHFASGDNPRSVPFANITYQHNAARQMTLNGGYDALLSIESDMIVPPDTVTGLIDADADIAYGLYVSRHKPYRWLAFKEVTLWGVESISRDYTGEDARAAWGKIIDVVGIGMGCTLIKRNVLEHLRFRLHDGSHSWIQDEYAGDFRKMGINPYGNRESMVCDDYLLALDAQHYGYSQRCNMNIVCGHINGKGVIWPDLEAKSFYRIESIEEH